VGIHGLHADDPASGRGPFPAAAVAIVATIDNVADAPTHAQPQRFSLLRLWRTASQY